MRGVTRYYNFSDLEKWEYTLLQEKGNNWNIVSPEWGRYDIYLNNGQSYKDLNFVNKKIQWKKNK